MIKSITLLSCRSPFLDDSKIYVPLASLYLKSYIERELPDVRVILADDNDELIGDTEAVGVSIMTPQREEANKILQKIKSKDPNKMVIAGGPHVKHYLQDIKREGWDYLVPLDGERALTQILRGEVKGRIVSDVMGKQDILKSPRPDRTSEEAKKILANYHYSLQGRRATTMMTGRGCPEKCHFCEDAMTNIKWSSIDNIIDELDDIKDLGFGGVYIFDDLFAIARKMVQPICDELEKRDLIYRCNGQARYFTREGEAFAQLLADTGCVEIAFGHESGSQKILDSVEKRTTIKQNYDSVEYAKKHGIKVKSFLMLGLPGETQETIKETEDFIRNSGVDDFQLSIYFPYKGTQIRDQIDDGIANIDLQIVEEGLGAYGQKGGSTESVVRTRSLSARELLEERDRLVREYKPKSHFEKWKDEDNFFESHLARGGE